MKKMVPDHNGTPLEPMVAGDVVTNLSYTFNGEYDGETTRNDQVNTQWSTPSNSLMTYRLWFLYKTMKPKWCINRRGTPTSLV